MADPPFQKACDPERMREVARPGSRPKNAVVGLKTGSSGDARRPQVKSTGGGQSPPVVVFQQTTKSNKQTMETNNSVKATGGGQCPVHWAKPLSRTVVFQKKKHMQPSKKNSHVPAAAVK